MIDFKQKAKDARVKIREKFNKYLGPIRRNKLLRNDFTIICNNCWGGHVYRYFNHDYTSPTIGLYLYSEDYIKFIYNLQHYIDMELTFINFTESKWKDDLILHNNTRCPIGKLGDIEIIFLHYRTPQEAYEKWNRRKKRIVWDNIVYKMSEQNLCTIDHLKQFDEFPENRKLVFVTGDYGLKSQVFWGGECERGNIAIDTILFREYVDLPKFINGNPDFRKRQKHARHNIEKL